MKIVKQLLLLSALGLLTTACSGPEIKNWDVAVKPAQSFALEDISKDFYNPKLSLADFQKQYPWFLNADKADFYEKKRVHSFEISTYQTCQKSFPSTKLQSDLADLFAHIKHYFPKFKSPKVYTFSSAVAMYQDPIMYNPQSNELVIDLSSFLGDNHQIYQQLGLDLYVQHSMTPQNLMPKVAMILAQEIVPYNANDTKFINKMIYHGKLMVLLDAFLPKATAHHKMGYTQKQNEWALANQANVWDYFVENQSLFSDDASLNERFIQIGPFSKFYREIDRQSSPQIGIYTGWQICKTYFEAEKDTDLAKFLLQKPEDIFTTSKYKPKHHE
jgi:hypothetical protein